MINQPRMITAHNGVSERIIHQSACSILEKCGGCGLLDLTYKNQLLQKTIDLKSRLQETGTEFNSIFIKDCIGSEEYLGYRRSVKLIISEQITYKKKSEVRWINIGFYRQSLNEVVDIARCPTLSNTLNDIIAWLRSGIKLNDISVHSPHNKKGLLQSITLRSSKYTKQVIIVFSTSQQNPAALRPLARQISEKFTNVQGVFMESTDSLILLSGQNTIEEKYNDYTFKFSAKSQIPANHLLSQRISARIKELADLSGKETVVTLCADFAGIALTLAKSSRAVIALGNTKQCIEDGRINAINNQCKNIDFYDGKFEEVLTKLKAEKNIHTADVIVLTAPQSGISNGTAEMLHNLSPRSLIYYSSFAATLTQDLKKLLATGFKAVFIEQYDSLPGTVHYDLLCYLVKS